jgi:tetratricopeptide (TPR) repeat protein
MELQPQLRQHLDGLGRRFLVEFYEAELARNPDNLEALAELGHLHTLLGDLERGLAIDRRLVRLVPGEPTARYNLACSLALLGHREEALESLETAVELGYDDPDHLLGDEDLASLREEPRFRALVGRLTDGVARP